MELSVMERYVAFICDELPKTKRVLLNPPPPMENGEYGYTRISKIGPKVYMETTIEIVETYTRSAKLCIKFEDYQKTDIFYMSRHKGPDKLLEEIDKKIDKIVNKTLIEDGRQEWVREQYKIKSENFPLFKISPGVEVDVYGDLYEKYCKIAGNVEEPDYDIHIEDLNQNCTRLMTKDEFIDKLKTDDEFNKTWGGMRKNDRFSLGIKKYGYDSEFRKEYESITSQLRHKELDEFFDKWEIPNNQPIKIVE